MCLHFERIKRHHTGQGLGIFHMFFIAVNADGALFDFACDAGLFARFIGGRLRRGQAIFGPSFWQDPSLCAPGGDEQYLHDPLFNPITQRTKLRPCHAFLFGVD